MIMLLSCVLLQYVRDNFRQAKKYQLLPEKAYFYGILLIRLAMTFGNCRWQMLWTMFKGEQMLSTKQKPCKRGPENA